MRRLRWPLTGSVQTYFRSSVRAFVERIEQLDTELQELNEQKKEVFAEAKGVQGGAKSGHPAAMDQGSQTLILG